MPDHPQPLPAPPPGKSGWPWIGFEVSGGNRDASWPRISIVTPSYNQAAFIEETIRSVLLQGYPNLQYIVIDGGSTDGSVDIIQKYTPWIDYWESTPDRGQSHAINKGLSRCNGEWFNWLNSDDYLFPGALQFLASSIRDQPQVMITAGRTRNLRQGELRESYGCRLSQGRPEGLFSLGLNQPGSLLRLAPVRECGLTEELHYTMDLALWIRLLLQGELKLIDHEIAAYRYHENSKTCSAADVFAPEEFSVLHDLFLSLVSSSATEALRRVRALCPAPQLAFTAASPVNTTSITRAFFDRLFVTDSLLFRALRGFLKDDRRAFPEFLRLIDCLRPVLQSVYAGNFAAVESRALLHALQETGRITSWPAARRVLFAARTPATVRALLRLWLKS
ncbi:glycosyltransferase family 2 protein [Rariglobus hedericola]|uniref:Glycosyltransferase n=1 Tax=Rariglobus hedericola TaxID=2597822 RepID=A0A556QPW1_9BACT|nr:glycosyltransferase family 2 protein [Rariglobus hedericola]TSJ78684.1 glycosyltransferase [Rariglobus hedericola]